MLLQTILSIILVSIISMRSWSTLKIIELKQLFLNNIYYLVITN